MSQVGDGIKKGSYHEEHRVLYVSDEPLSFSETSIAVYVNQNLNTNLKKIEINEIENQKTIDVHEYKS